ncbi:hypothetical protein BU24DRAFT_254369 [Aaosphaeria arxii CBS 175.79]|uniref:Uncharacterized protein n=1 Tax=Aaosphaeria arxii CBS 175.79 TaxID=1450172 RepID=A0A6A5XHH2_9PLEO|nr:uncharacterized protein BU24DRAFT_254369 [Aaosphaeria arxii CBS 175.79]KAF2012562.1 hypothetical protein BU24DRAFT_254369 [Aaosphaeria arxii CBS 175.79]
MRFQGQSNKILRTALCQAAAERATEKTWVLLTSADLNSFAISSTAFIIASSSACTVLTREDLWCALQALALTEMVIMSSPLCVKVYDYVDFANNTVGEDVNLTRSNNDGEDKGNRVGKGSRLLPILRHAEELWLSNVDQFGPGSTAFGLRYHRAGRRKVKT